MESQEPSLTDDGDVAPPVVPEPAAEPTHADAPASDRSSTTAVLEPRPKPRSKRAGRSAAYALDLLVIRHGPAGDREAWAADGHDDDDRPLTPRGTRQMRRATRGLQRLVKSVDALGTSPLVRARETAAIAAQMWDTVPEEVPSLGDGDRRGIIRWVRRTAANLAKKRDSGDRIAIAIVGHEPDLSALIAWLLTGRASESTGEPWIELKKGGACLLSFDSRPQPRQARLRWSLTRSQLERLRRA